MKITIVDAELDTDIKILENNTEFDISDLPKKINFRADPDQNTAFQIGSVRFELYRNDEVIHTRTENVAPYTMFGDRQGNYYVWETTEGEYYFRVQPYSERLADGTPGELSEYHFSIQKPETQSEKDDKATMTESVVSTKPIIRWPLYYLYPLYIRYPVFFYYFYYVPYY